MTNEKEMVEQVALSDLPLEEQIRIIRGNYCIGSGEFDALDEAADVVECHQLEIELKDAEIARLKACISGDCERTKLGAEPCAGCFREHARQEIAERDVLIKELAEAIDKVLPGNADCCDVKNTLCKDGCMQNGKCNIDVIRAIAAKAREVVVDNRDKGVAAQDGRDGE